MASRRGSRRRGPPARPPRAGSLVLVAALAVAACSSGQEVSSGTTSASTPTLPSSRSTTVPSTQPTSPETTAGSAPACDPARAAEGGLTSGSITSSGAERTYVLSVPPTYDGSGAAPLILNLHGLGSNGSQQLSYSRLGEVAGERGYVVVAPDAQGSPAIWAVPLAGGESSRDLIFVRDLLELLEGELCLDADRVYVVGISNGALFAAYLACELGKEVRGLGLVAGTSRPRGCPEDLSLPVLAFAGTADPLVPYEGGTGQIGRLRFPVPPAEEAIADWASVACPSPPTESRVASDVVLVSYEGCSNGDDAQLYRIEGGGHTWPGSRPFDALLGPTSQSIDASELLVEFFDAHP